MRDKSKKFCLCAVWRDNVAIRCPYLAETLTTASRSKNGPWLGKGMKSTCMMRAVDLYHSIPGDVCVGAGSWSGPVFCLCCGGWCGEDQTYVSQTIAKLGSELFTRALFCSAYLYAPLCKALLAKFLLSGVCETNVIVITEDVDGFLKESRGKGTLAFSHHPSSLPTCGCLWMWHLI